MDKAASNEYGRLFQGCGRNEDGSQQIEGTNACHWIKKNQVPKGKQQPTTEKLQISD